MGHKTYSRTSPKDGRRATLGTNGKYSRRNNKGWLINQGIGNLVNQGNEQRVTYLTNTNNGSTNETNNGGTSDTGGTTDGGTTNTTGTGYTVNNNAYDGNNDGYGTVGISGGVSTDYGFNMVGEYSIDIRPFGSWSANATVFEYAVERLNVGETTAVGYQPLFSQNGLADGLNGYVRYRSGSDSYVSAQGYRQSQLDTLTNEGVTFRSLQASWDQDEEDETVYLGNNTGSISVGDSLFSDATGQIPLADGLTNNRPNRYWFVKPDPITDIPMITKVTSGVVTHHYAWNSGVEGYRGFSSPSHWKKQVYLGNNVYNSPADVNATMQGKQYVGNNPGGSIQVINAFQVAVDEAQDMLNDGWAITSNNSSNSYLDFRTDDEPYAVGKFLYKNASNNNTYQRVIDNLEIDDQELTYSVTFNGQTFTVDNTYKAEETRFKYLPLMGSMTTNFNYDYRNKAIIVIEYKPMTGEIVNQEIVAKNNGLANLHARTSTGQAIT